MPDHERIGDGPVLSEAQEQQLLAYLDDRLSPDERSGVDAWLARDADLRRLLDEHRRTWELLGELPVPDEASPGAGFRENTVQRAHREERLRQRGARRRAMGVLAAAALVMALVLVLRDRPEPWARLTPEERHIVQNLELLENFDLLQQFETELDLAADVEALQAFEGELTETLR